MQSPRGADSACNAAEGCVATWDSSIRETEGTQGAQEAQGTQGTQGAEGMQGAQGERLRRQMREGTDGAHSSASQAWRARTEGDGVCGKRAAVPMVQSVGSDHDACARTRSTVHRATSNETRGTSAYAAQA